MEDSMKEGVDDGQKEGQKDEQVVEQMVEQKDDQMDDQKVGPVEDQKVDEVKDQNVDMVEDQKVDGVEDQMDIFTSPKRSPPSVSYEAVTPSEALTRKRSNCDILATEDEPPAKKQRIATASASCIPPVCTNNAVVDTRQTFDSDPWMLLQRSTALVLEQVGFDATSKMALEALCAEADAYATKILSYVTESMLSARRAQPTPLDFEYALRRGGLNDRLLRPHLKPPISPSKTQIALEAASPYKPVQEHLTGLLGKELDGRSDKLARSYIPKGFPDFPSKHTYKSTSVMPEREKDPRKIREKATEAARAGEEALRRLVNVGKAGDIKGIRKASEKNMKHKIKHELWQRTMEFLAADNPVHSKKNNAEDDELSILVDAGKKYRRKPQARERG